MVHNIDSLLERELQHTEEAERHGDQTRPEPAPLSNDPADPDHAGSQQSARPQPPARERAPWTHLSNALQRNDPPHEAGKGLNEYQASLERNLPDITGQGLHGYTATPPPGTPTQEWEEQ